MNNSLIGIMIVIFVSMCGALGAFFMKLGADSWSWKINKLIKNKAIWGLVLNGIGVILMTVAYRFGDLSVLYPFVALQYVWSSFLAMKYLKEKMSYQKWIGVSIIIFSVALIGISS
ncbi:EamA/RhaT family transporter [Candidatus Woesearchaeota archaeon]|jgi:uncharacterized membrane protein|nr:EamA/RhaT family transporter [Candidatus Woesearchaeota archaeon]